LTGDTATEYRAPVKYVIPVHKRGATWEDTVIARLWRGATRAEDAESYLAYLRETGLEEYAATPGNLGVMAFRRVRDGQAEFLLVSLWESEDAIRAFAGDRPDRAVFYPEDDRYLVAKEDHVQHYDCVHGEGVPARRG
jgi:heme-degrading monooxygenase HmoA